MFTELGRLTAPRIEYRDSWWPTLEFAGRIEGTDVSPALADFVGDGAFLTRWNNDILEPASIDGDYVFEAADADTAYQRVIYQPVTAAT